MICLSKNMYRKISINKNYKYPKKTYYRMITLLQMNSLEDLFKYYIP